MNKCHTHNGYLSKFIENINGNWRNSVYITCSVCRFQKESDCGDMLASFDEDGIPTIIMAADANFLFDTIVDKSDCLCEISNAKFYCLFENLFKKYADENLPVCMFRQLMNRK